MHADRRRFSQSLLGLGGAWLAGSAPAATPPPLPLQAPPPGFESLDALAQRKGMRFGNAMGLLPSGKRTTSRFHDPAYRALMARECGVIVAENETKWQALRPSRDRFEFGPADEVFAWAKSQGMLIRGHTLVWQDPEWLPAWVNDFKFGAAPAKEAESLLAEHIGTVCRHFGRDIVSWDVVNEAVDPDNGGLRRNVFTQQLGAVEQIDLAFRLAREHAPHAQLVYNDYVNWGAGNAKHRAGTLKLLGDLKARGAPVQALGLQAHIGSWSEGPDASKPEVEWQRFLDEVSAMGLELLITEFDVHDRYLPADIATRDAVVASMARDWLDLTLSYPRLRTMMTWGLADHVSWLQDGWPRSDGLAKRPAPYDAQLQPKPLRRAIADALRAMPERARA